MELPKGEITPEEYWTQHIQAAEKFKGTNKEYCKKYGIKLGSLSAYRKKLGYSTPRNFRKNKFATVSVEKTPPQKRSSDLPDPAWLASFLKAWVS